MKMRVARDDIAEVIGRPGDSAVSPLEAARSAGSRSRSLIPEDTVRSELNVIGRTVEEATGEVEQYLDRAFPGRAAPGTDRARHGHGGFAQGAAGADGAASARGPGRRGQPQRRRGRRYGGRSACLKGTQPGRFE
jgi:hypothetical protein